MKQRSVIVICDGEKQYAQHLLEYLQGEKNIPYETVICYSARNLEAYTGNMNIALLVISESEYEVLSESKKISGAGKNSVKTPEQRWTDPKGPDPGSSEHKEQSPSGTCSKADITKEKADKASEKADERSILILKETDSLPDPSGPPCISKYQSMTSITGEILIMCLDAKAPGPALLRSKGALHVIGVYTPITRTLSTTLALTMGQLLAANNEVLYMNMENYSGFTGLLQRSFRGSLTELVYYNDCVRDRFCSQLSMITEKAGQLDIVPPAASFPELKSIKGEQWLSLISSIDQMTQYDYLILDISEVDGFIDILHTCEKVITLIRADAISEAKLCDYRQYLSSSGGEDILTNTMFERLPVFSKLPADYTNLTHGPFAEYVKDMLKEL